VSVGTYKHAALLQLLRKLIRKSGICLNSYENCAKGFGSRESLVLARNPSRVLVLDRPEWFSKYDDVARTKYLDMLRRSEL